MSRTIPTSILTALNQTVVAPIFAVEFLLDSGDIRLWNGYEDITLNGNTFTGAGNLLSIGDLEEVADLSAKGTSISLSGVPSGYISVALNAHYGDPEDVQRGYQRRPCNIYFGVYGVTDTINTFSGYIDTMTIEDTSDSATITVTVESKLIELERTRERRYTHESQKLRYSTDTFFSFVTDLQDKEINWGKATPGKTIQKFPANVSTGAPSEGR